MKEKARIMDAQAMGRAVQRIGYEIVERNKGTENVVLIGIQRRGVPLSQRIAGHIDRVEETTGLTTYKVTYFSHCVFLLLDLI